MLLETHGQKTQKKNNVYNTNMVAIMLKQCYHGNGFVDMPTAINDQVAVFVINNKYGVSRG